MSNMENFSKASKASYFTPQREMDAIIRHCAEGTSVHGDSDLKAAPQLLHIVAGIESYLSGNMPDSNLASDPRLSQLLVLERESIKAVIETACPKEQTKALREIISHGSLSSAALNAAKTVRPAPVSEFAPILERS